MFVTDESPSAKSLDVVWIDLPSFNATKFDLLSDSPPILIVEASKSPVEAEIVNVSILPNEPVPGTSN